VLRDKLLALARTVEVVAKCGPSVGDISTGSLAAVGLLALPGRGVGISSLNT
jgi:hypothetical protein